MKHVFITDHPTLTEKLRDAGEKVFSYCDFTYEPGTIVYFVGSVPKSLPPGMIAEGIDNYEAGVIAGLVPPRPKSNGPSWLSYDSNFRTKVSW